jgi:hypothetical protein
MYQLAEIPAPEGMATHHPVPHVKIVNSLLETLAFRYINIVRDQYATSPLDPIPQFKSPTKFGAFLNFCQKE